MTDSFDPAIIITNQMQQLYPSLINRLENQYQSIGHILLQIDNEHLFKRPQPNKWNIHDNIAHLTRYQQIFIDRINQILQKENLFFGRYVAEEDPAFENIRQLKTADLLQQLNSDRKNIYGLLINLSNKELIKTATHKKFGILNIPQWTEFFLLHESHHIYTIFQLANDTTL